jgi:pimeloyl-ACP methyl ester carboxylesterase
VRAQPQDLGLESSSKENAVATTQIAGPVGSLHVDDGGSGGLPVILTHSFGGSAAQWAPQLAHLRRGRRAVALDFRAHGQSEPPRDGDYSVAGLAADIGAVADGLELDRFVIAGHGLGGSASIAYAADNPTRVAGLLLAVAPGKVPTDQAEQVMSAMRSAYEKTSAGFMERLLGGAQPAVREQILGEKQLTREPALQLLEASLTNDSFAALRRYPGPKLSITASTGETPFDLHKVDPALPHESISDASHWLQLDKPDEFNRLLDRFLAEVDAAERQCSQAAAASTRR